MLEGQVSKTKKLINNDYEYLGVCPSCKKIVKYLGGYSLPHTKTGVEITCKEFALHEEQCENNNKKRNVITMIIDEDTQLAVISRETGKASIITTYHPDVKGTGLLHVQDPPKEIEK